MALRGRAARSRGWAITIDERTFWTFALAVRKVARCGAIPELGKVRIVVSYANADLTGTYVVLEVARRGAITNRLDWSAERIIRTYLRRWPKVALSTPSRGCRGAIETFYQDSKQYLGLDEYRMRSAEAFKKHWCLVFVAYSLLHLDCLAATDPPLRGGEPKAKTLIPIKTISHPSRGGGEACRQQSQALKVALRGAIESLILYAHEQLSMGADATDVFAALFAAQQPLEAVTT